MDEEMRKYLMELAGNTKDFKPNRYYSHYVGGRIEFFITNDDYYAEWINHHISVYRRREDDAIIGGCIGEVDRAIEDYNEKRRDIEESTEKDE